MVFTDLLELKRILGIDPRNPAQDGKLLFLIEHATGLLTEIMNRPPPDKKLRTEVYEGTGSQAILLRNRPVFNDGTLSVVVDESANFGQASGAFANAPLTLGVDYYLKIDQEDGSSRSGILYRLNAYWPRQGVRARGYLTPFMGRDPGSVQVTYTAGYTCDTLPPQLRMACNLLVARLNGIFPHGMEISSEAYQDRSIAFAANNRDYLLSLAKPLALAFRNWRW